MSTVYVFGHKNPDNDAIMSAVVLSQLLNQVNYDGNTYVARRLGSLPAESAKLLADNGVAEPELLEVIEAADEPQQVVLTDHNEDGQTVDKTRALGMIDEIREAMRAYQADKGADGIVLCVTDIMEEGSQVLFEGATEVAQKGLGIADEHDGVWMPGVLSRKKQVAAPILAAAE